MKKESNSLVTNQTLGTDWNIITGTWKITQWIPVFIAAAAAAATLFAPLVGATRLSLSVIVPLYVLFSSICILLAFEGELSAFTINPKKTENIKMRLTQVQLKRRRIFVKALALLSNKVVLTLIVWLLLHYQLISW